MSLSLGSAVTYCLLLCGGVCEAAGSIAFGFCGFAFCLEGVFSIVERGLAPTGSLCILKEGHISCACRAFFSRSRFVERVFPGRVQGEHHML